MEIATNLRRLRRERDVTQEELAAHLGISFQAVSKWERGEGYPDITHLPALTNFFGVTADELLGMDEERKKDRMENYYYKRQNEIMDAYSDPPKLPHDLTPEEWDAMIKLSREGLREFAGAFKYEQIFLNMLEIAANFAEEPLAAQLLRETLPYYEKYLENGTDAGLIELTKNQLAHVLSRLGETERAVAVARTLLGENAGHLVLSVSRGRKGVKEALAQIESSALRIDHALSVLRDAEDENGPIYSDAEKLELTKKSLMMRDFIQDGVPSQHTVFTQGSCVSIAGLALKTGRRGCALDYIERAADYALGRHKSDYKIPGILFAENIRVLTNAAHPDRDRAGLIGFLCRNLLEGLRAENHIPLDDGIRSDPRFLAVIAELEKHAGGAEQ